MMAPAATASATAPTPSTNHNNPTIVAAVAARKPCLQSVSHRRSDTFLIAVVVVTFVTCCASYDAFAHTVASPRARFQCAGFCIIPISLPRASPEENSHELLFL